MPTSAKSIQLKYLARICNGMDKSGVESPDGTIPIYGSGGQFSTATHALYTGDSVLLGRKGTIDKPLFVSGSFWTVDTMYYTKINQELIDPKFFFYLCNTINFEYYKSGSVLPSMTKEDLGAIKFRVMPLDKQQKIREHLDKKLHVVDLVINSFERRLELIGQYRQSLITRAVTKGLDPNVEMKASGVQWIGNMPSHWRICRVKNLFSVVCGATPSPNPQYWNGNINWIGPSDMDEIGDVSSGKRSITREGYESCGTTLVPQGSLVLSTRAPVGKVNIAKEELCTNQGCKSLVPLGSKNYTKYYYFVLQAAKDQLIQDSSGTTFLELSTSALSDELLPLPSLDEQKRIVSFLEKIDEMVLELKVKLSDSIRLLNEYRSSLISAAVTGQLAIEEAAE